jgi:small GTP-binding protein
VVYDITKEISFRNIKKWIEGIKEHAAENVVIVIVGNKSDLKAIQAVNTMEGKSLAKELGCFFEETSALTGDNIEQTFQNMLECSLSSIQRFKNGRSRKRSRLLKVST